MVALLEPESSTESIASFWRNPSAWIRQQKLSRGFWVFFTAAFFFDAGFAVYVFLFNLYLLDHMVNAMVNPVFALIAGGLAGGGQGEGRRWRLSRPARACSYRHATSTKITCMALGGPPDRRGSAADRMAVL